MSAADLSGAVTFLARCVAVLAEDERAFALTLIGAVLLGAVCWWVCTHYSKLWNLRFTATALHNTLCAVAAALTMVFTVAYVSLGRAQELARADVRSWSGAILSDRPFWNEAFSDAYHAVRRRGREDFSRHPAPEHGGRQIPLNAAESRQIAASLYAERACAHFQAQHPFLSRVMWTNSAAPARQVAADVNDWFAKHPGRYYDATKAIELATRIIDRSLAAQSSRVVFLSRAAAVAAFALAQAVPLIIIGWAAYRDLHETV